MSATATSIRLRLEAEVADGQRVPGDRLPTVRAFAAELGVSPNTVAAAYKQLRDRGVVVGRGRQGTVIAPQTRPARSQVTPIPDGTIDALRGSPDQSFLPDLGPAFAAAASGDSVQYGDQLVDPTFAAAAADMLAADQIDPSHFTVTSGAMDAIEKILGSNDLRPGDRVGVEDPGHIPVHQLVRSFGLHLVPLAVDDHGVRPNSLQGALEQGLAGLIVTPRAHNPTGAAFTEERATELSALLSDHPGLLLVQDDHAGAISGTPWFPLTPPGPRHAIIRSLGKSLGPDLRISVTAGDPVTIDRLAMAVSNGPGWVSHMLQRAAGFLLTDPATAKLVASAEASYSQRRELLIAALAKQGIAATGRSGINVWIPTNDEQAAVEAARHAGFAIRAADAYRVNSDPAVRATIANLRSDQIIELAKALGNAASGMQHSPAM